MTSQHDRQDEKLTGQLPNKSGHCPLTGRYFAPCLVCIKTILAAQSRASFLGIDQSDIDHSFAEEKLLLTTASHCCQVNPRIKTLLIRHEGTCTTYLY